MEWKLYNNYDIINNYIDDDIEKDCKNAGMDGSISKPITPPKL